jgi:hypothetical protein
MGKEDAARMAKLLSYETPTDLRPGMVDRFDAPGKVTLIVHPHAPWFGAGGGVLLFVNVVSALVSIAMIGAGALMSAWVFSVCILVMGVGGFLVLWNRARTRVVFELLKDRLYVARVGPLARSQQLWARETMKNIAVYKVQEPTEQSDPPVTWRYDIRIWSNYRGRHYLHRVLANRSAEFLRGVANELRLELGWAEQEAGKEIEL